MLLFMDGQAHYDSAGIETKYSAVDATNNAWSVVAEGRFGNCIKRVSTSNGGGGHLSVAPLTTRLGPWAPTTGGVCGFAVKVDDLQRSSYSMVDNWQRPAFFGVWEGNGFHVNVFLNKNGTFSLVRSQTGSGGSIVIIAQSTEGLTDNAWAYVEFKWVIDAVAGMFEIHVNGIPVLVYNGRTRSQAIQHVNIGVWNAVLLLGVESMTPPYLVLRMCDLYLADLNAALLDDVRDFLNDGIITTILPNGPGDATGWTPTPAPNWDAVNDRPAADGDTTYVQATNPGTLDRYHFEDLPASVTQVKGVHLNILARKLTEGASSLAPVVNATLGPEQGVTGVAYDRYLTQAWDLNPATGLKFTAAEINASQFGMQKTR